MHTSKEKRTSIDLIEMKSNASRERTSKRKKNRGRLKPRKFRSVLINR